MGIAYKRFVQDNDAALGLTVDLISEGIPCYVETFNERDLAFFRHSFRIAGGGHIPRGGPDFWALIRPPQTG
jgi:hypothetical protein